MFEGWEVDNENGVLYDEDGNYYYKDEIRAIFYYRQIVKDFEGSTAEILSLKELLNKKQNQVPAPVVTIDWGDVQEKYVHPFFRNT